MKDVKDNLRTHSIKDYFKIIESAIEKNESVETLTAIFSIDSFTETKPYLVRRQLRPADKRFNQIELVYKDINKVQAIIWDVDISLSQLRDIFGDPIVHNEPYDNSTAFAFKSKNPNIEIVKTRHSKCLTKTDDYFEYQNESNEKIKLTDPQFNFVQINIDE